MASSRRAALFLLWVLVAGAAGASTARAEATPGPPDDRRAAPQPAAGAARPAGAPRFAGLPLPRALDDLRAQGLDLVYSSDLVRPDMIVAAEPPPLPPRQVLDLLIAPFGLEATDGPGGRVLIVRSTDGRPAPSDPAGGARHNVDARPLTTVPGFRERIEVTSRGSAPGGEQVEPRSSVGPDEMARLPQVGGDPNRTIARLPGVASGDKSAALRVRGGHTDESLVLLDGLALDEPFHLKDFLSFSSIVDARALGGASILTGVFPAEYGDRLSGVVDLSTVDPEAPGRTVVGTSLINSSFLSAGTWGPGGGCWLVSARSWYPDAVVDVVDPGGEEINPAYHDLLGKAEVRLPGGSILSAHLLASRDGVDFRSDERDSRVEAGEDNRYLWFNLKTPWTARLGSQTVLWQSRLDRSRDGGVAGAAGDETRVSDARSSASVGLKQDWFFETGERSSLKWGWNGRRITAEYDYASHVEYGDPAAGGVPPAGPSLPPSVDRALRLSPAGVEFGAYVAGRLRPAEPLTVEIGLRWDRQTLANDAQPSPRLNLLYAPGPRTSLRAGWGLFHQAQGIHELQVEDGVDRFYPAERAEHRQIGVDHAFAGGLILGVTAYDKEMSRLRPRYENLFNPIPLFPESGPDRVLVAPGRARARGIEISLGRDGGRPLAWRAGYALASAEDEIDGAWVPRSWDQRHTLDFNVNYRRGRGWEFNVSGRYHSGWPATSVRAEMAPNPDGTLGVRPIVGSRNAARYPPYHRLDVRMSRRIALERGSLTAFLEVTNLYGRDNVCCVSGFTYLPQADGSVRVEPHYDYWLRELPVAGLTWEF